MKKAQKIFLFIGFAVLVITFVFFAINTVLTFVDSYSTASNDDIYGASGEWFWILLNFLLIPVPFLLSELSLIKNAYLLLGDQTAKHKKICCCVSSFLALFVIVMIILVETQNFGFRTNNTILLTLLPATVVSLVLSGKLKPQKQ